MEPELDQRLRAIEGRLDELIERLPEGGRAARRAPATTRAPAAPRPQRDPPAVPAKRKPDEPVDLGPAAAIPAPPPPPPPVPSSDTPALPSRPPAREAARTASPAKPPERQAQTAPVDRPRPPVPPPTTFGVLYTGPRREERAPREAVTASPFPQSKPPAPPKRPRRPRDLERFLGLSVLGRIGIAAVLLAAGYFAQYTYGRVTPVAKITGLYLLAAALLTAGRLLRPRVSKLFTALLWGGGIAVAYLAGAAAYMIYHIIEAPVAFALLIGAVVLGQWLARSLRLQVMATIALLGGFAAPVLIEAGFDSSTFLCAYVILLHTWSVFTERAWGWRLPRLASGAALVALAAAWWLLEGTSDLATALHINAYLIALVTPELIDLVRGRVVGEARQAWLLSAAALAQGLLCFTLGTDQPGYAWFPGAMALLYSLRLTRNELTEAHEPLASGMNVIALALLFWAAFLVPQLFDLVGRTAVLARVGAFSTLGLGLFMLRARMRLGDVPAFVAAVASALVVWLTPSELASPYAVLPAVIMTSLLVLHGRIAWMRTAALGLGALTIFMGLQIPGTQGAPWLPGLAVVLTGVYLVAGVVRARTRRDQALLSAGLWGLGTLAAMWATMAFSGQIWLGRAALDWGMASGVALGLMTFGCGVWRRRALSINAQVCLSVVGLAVLVLTSFRAVDAWMFHELPPTRWTAFIGLMVAWAHAFALLERMIPVRAYARTAAITTILGALLLPAAAGVGTFEVAHFRPVVGLLFLLIAATPILLRALTGRLDRWTRVGVLASQMILIGVWLIAAIDTSHEVLPLIFNLQFLSGLGVIAVGAITARTAPLPGIGPLAWRLVGFLLLGYVAGLLEVIEATRGSVGNGAAVAISVYSALYAFGMLVGGFARKLPGLRYAALAMFGLLVLKVGLLDLANADLELRILVAGALGLILLAGAFGYSRRRQDDDEADPDRVSANAA